MDTFSRRAFLVSISGISVGGSGIVWSKPNNDDISCNVSSCERVSETKAMELLEKIKTHRGASYDGEVHYACGVVTKTGDAIDNVYFVREQYYEDHWGLYPTRGDKISMINFDDVRDVFESPKKIKRTHADKIAGFMETGMGYRKFYFHMDDGTQLLAFCGNTNDFFSFPEPYSRSQVLEVSEYKGNGMDPVQVYGADYTWCLLLEG